MYKVHSLSTCLLIISITCFFAICFSWSQNFLLWELKFRPVPNILFFRERCCSWLVIFLLSRKRQLFNHSRYCWQRSLNGYSPWGSSQLDSTGLLTLSLSLCCWQNSLRGMFFFIFILYILAFLYFLYPRDFLLDIFFEFLSKELKADMLNWTKHVCLLVRFYSKLPHFHTELWKRTFLSPLHERQTSIVSLLSLIGVSWTTLWVLSLQMVGMQDLKPYFTVTFQIAWMRSW